MIDTIGMTDIGNGRPSNQDAYLLRQKEKNGKLYLLAVVCDGMGGLGGGELASYTACARFEKRRDCQSLYRGSIKTMV